MHSASAQSTTTDIIVNIRRFIDYPFRQLSFAVDTVCDIECAAHSIKGVRRVVFPFLSLMSGIFEEGGRNLNERPGKSESPGRQLRRCRNQLEIG
jgi:hypothetical protein